MTEYCEGCRTYSEYYPSTDNCDLIKNNTDVPNCPCALCIIKAMCTVGCRPFNVFKKTIRRAKMEKDFHGL